jgi:isopentenyldiphosphate isomerase
MPKFEYPPSLNEYAVTASEYLEQHKEYDFLCTGVAVFNTDGKLLLVQRAANEKAFPEAWVGAVVNANSKAEPLASCCASHVSMLIRTS